MRFLFHYLNTMIFKVVRTFLDHYFTHHEIFSDESRHLGVSAAHVAYVNEEGVHVIQTFDALVQGVHDLGGVLRQLCRTDLRFNGAQVTEVFKQM